MRFVPLLMGHSMYTGSIGRVEMSPSLLVIHDRIFLAALTLESAVP